MLKNEEELVAHCTHRCSNWWMLECSDVGWVGGVWVLWDLIFTAKQLVLWYSNMRLMIMRRTSNWICHRCPLPLPYKSALPFNLWLRIGIMCRMWRRKVLGGWVLWCGKGFSWEVLLSVIALVRIPYQLVNPSSLNDGYFLLGDGINNILSALIECNQMQLQLHFSDCLHSKY